MDSLISDKSDAKLFQKYEMLKVFCNKKITHENIVSCIIFAMKLFKKSSMSGLTKKETVTKLLLTLIKECVEENDSILDLFNEKYIGIIIDSIYAEFDSSFKSKKCLRLLCM